MNWVSRGEPYLSRISRSSFLMMVKTRASFARMSRKSLIVLISSLYSLVDLFPLESGQLIQAQIENLVCLVFAESVAAFGQSRFVANENADLLDLFSREFESEQFNSRFIAIGRSADDADEFIEIRQGDEITFERFGAFLRFTQFETCPAQNHFAAMIDVSGDSPP